jgi:hypothetical protein
MLGARSEIRLKINKIRQGERNEMAYQGRRGGRSNIINRVSEC